MAIKTFQSATKPASSSHETPPPEPFGPTPTPPRLIPGLIENATYISYQRLSDPREDRGVENTARQLLRNTEIAAGRFGPIRVPAKHVGPVEPFTDDGISAAPDQLGNLKHRPDWEAYLAAIEALRPTYALAIRPDRWVREQTQLNRLIYICQVAGTFLATESRIYDPNNPDDVFDLKREALRGEEEVVRSRKRVNGTLRTFREQGIMNNPGPRYGLAWVEVQVDFNKTKRRLAPGYVMDEAETAVLRRMKDMYLGRGIYTRKHSIEEIARELDKDGVPTPKGGERWYRVTVKKLMTRAINIGHLEYEGELGARMQGVEEDAETIYTREEFDEIIARMAKNYKAGAPRTPQKHTGSGLLYCRSCVKPLHAGQRLGAGRGNGYRCKNRKCSAPVLISAKHAERIIRKHAIALLASQDHISRINAVRDEDLSTWRALLDKVEAKEREHFEIVNDKSVPARTRATLGASLEDEINELRAEMNALAPDDPKGYYQELKAQAYDAVVAQWDAGTAEEQNGWARTVAKGFVVSLANAANFEFDASRVELVELQQALPAPLPLAA